jgi:hypothetical protein
MARRRKGKKSYKRCISTHTKGRCHKGMKGGKKKCLKRVRKSARRLCKKRR